MSGGGSLVIMIALAYWLCPKADLRVGPWIVVAFIPIGSIFAPWILLAQAVGIVLDRSEPEWDDEEWEEEEDWPLRCLRVVNGVLPHREGERMTNFDTPYQPELFSEDVLRSCLKHERGRLQRATSTFDEGWRVGELEERIRRAG